MPPAFQSPGESAILVSPNESIYCDMSQSSADYLRVHQRESQEPPHVNFTSAHVPTPPSDRTHTTSAGYPCVSQHEAGQAGIYPVLTGQSSSCSHNTHSPVPASPTHVSRGCQNSLPALPTSFTHPHANTHAPPAPTRAHSSPLITHPHPHIPTPYPIAPTAPVRSQPPTPTQAQASADPVLFPPPDQALPCVPGCFVPPEERVDKGWRPLILCLPLRLGLERVNPPYVPTLQALFTFPQCVGISGGKPRSSLFFVGFQGKRIFYLDPHHTQPTVKMDANAFNVSSYHCSKLNHMNIMDLDPSMCVGFYCHTRAEFDDLIRRTRELTTPEIFSICERTPAYLLE
eukprot:gnl/Trimastix_PCT/1325.p1 GENE.gnl/Trimastix_PCT/1325~~gnl/Trimastix_PCT/1325.p1  ORF type:complete len:344 (-),score=20.36 gnl/Trimastix_PCT/1325:107-1138(-)